MLIYHIILLKNNNLYYEYHSNGYLNHSIECSYLNDFVEHDTFNETVSRFILLDGLFEEIVNDPSSNAFQKNLIEFERQLRTENACDNTIEFLAKNEDELDIKLFVNVERMSREEFAKRCVEIGRGFNKNESTKPFEVSSTTSSTRIKISSRKENKETKNTSTMLSMTARCSRISSKRIKCSN